MSATIRFLKDTLLTGLMSNSKEAAYKGSPSNGVVTGAVTMTF